MRVVLQRVSRASVRVGPATVAEIGAGLLILVGIAEGDTAAEADALAGKVARLRIFPNEEGRFDRSLLDTGGVALVVSQFTLIAETTKGNRPSFAGAAAADDAELLVERFCAALRQLELAVESGRFGAQMQVELVNEGPVTIVL